MLDHLELAVAVIVFIGLAYMAYEILKADRKRPDDWDLHLDTRPRTYKDLEPLRPNDKKNMPDPDL